MELMNVVSKGRNGKDMKEKEVVVVEEEEGEGGGEVYGGTAGGAYMYVCEQESVGVLAYEVEAGRLPEASALNELPDQEVL